MPYTSPHQASASFSDLSVGTHTLSVTDGQPGSTPVIYTWTITAPPAPPWPPPVSAPAKPRITSHPAKVTRSRSATFRLADSTPGVTFEYSVDSKILKPSLRPAVYWNLKVGVHIFRVKVVTDSGAASQVVSFTWKVTKYGHHAQGQASGRA
jgi:hypothetical protein